MDTLPRSLDQTNADNRSHPGDSAAAGRLRRLLEQNGRAIIRASDADLLDAFTGDETIGVYPRGKELLAVVSYRRRSGRGGGQ